MFQGAFAQSLLSPLNVFLVELPPNGRPLPHINIITDSVYGPYGKHLSASTAHSRLNDYLVSFNNRLMIRTDI